MNFKTTLTLTCFALIASSSFAGKLYFVSSTVLTTPMPSTVSPFTAAGNASVSGKLFHTDLSLGLYPINPPKTGTVIANTLGSGTAEFKVRWEEDYPGEPKPSTLDAEWTVAQESYRYPLFFAMGGASGYLSMTGQAAPNGNENFSDTFTWPNIPPNTPTSDSATHVPSGAFSFANENGDWIGTGTFEIAIQLGLTGVMSRLSVMPSMWIKIDMTLTHAGGIAIL